MCQNEVYHHPHPTPSQTQDTESQKGKTALTRTIRIPRQSSDTLI